MGEESTITIDVNTLNLKILMCELWGVRMVEKCVVTNPYLKGRWGEGVFCGGNPRIVRKQGKLLNSGVNFRSTV